MEFVGRCFLLCPGGSKQGTRLYYFGGDPAVDFIGDGETNYFDAVEFVLAYQRGCDSSALPAW